MAERQVGYYYCSTCNREYLHPWDNSYHKDHKTYETGQAEHLALKLHILSETTKLLEMTRILLKQERLHIKTVEKSFKEITLAASKSIELHKSKPEYTRIGSWNLENLSNTHDDRIKSICKTILYHQFNIIALQEVCAVRVLDTIKKILNERSQEGWDYLNAERTGKEVPAIFFKTILRRNGAVLPLENNTHRRQPFSCRLNLTERKQLVIISVHLAYRPRDLNEKEVNDLKDVLQPHLEDRYVILLGDFNTGCREIKTAFKLFDGETKRKYSVEPVISDATNVAGTHTYDNVILSTAASNRLKRSLVGCIVPEGDMTPRQVSNHLPIYVDLDI